MQADQIDEIAEQLKAGAIGVIPTDTIYGISALAKNDDAIERIYQITNRPTNKPFIILINDDEQLTEFTDNLSEAQTNVLNEFWPGAFSIIIPVKDELESLHRGKGSLAFRLPKVDWLQELIAKTGPIISTSANMSGQPTPNNIEEIKQQLPGLDFYIEGETNDSASRLILLKPDASFEELQR